MEALSIEQTQAMIIYTAGKILEQADELGAIDRKIGDGDHGIGMSIGCREIIKIVKNKKYETVSEIFKDAGMGMIQTMGGASGVLFGSLFIGIAKETSGGKLTAAALASGMGTAVKEIKIRGGASLGDKTMLDSLEPAVQALRQASETDTDLNSGLLAAQAAAEKGVEATKKYPAKFGRARTLGERSVGYQDAGATSVYYLIKAMSEYVEGASK